MSTIINTQSKVFERQSHRPEGHNWMGDGWICVPKILEQVVCEHAPYCKLQIENGQLVDVISEIKPQPEIQTPSIEEKNRADIDYLLMLQGE